MTIKETAGKILLVLYYMQIANPADLDNKQILFQSMSQSKLETNLEFEKILHEINEDDSMLYNAFNYLFDKNFIAKRNKKDLLGGVLIIGPHLTCDGIDIIECVEQGEEPQRIVKSLFNFSFNFSPTMKVDSLIKSEVGNIVGIGGAVSGKIEAKK